MNHHLPSLHLMCFDDVRWSPIFFTVSISAQIRQSFPRKIFSSHCCVCASLCPYLSLCFMNIFFASRFLAHFKLLDLSCFSLFCFRSGPMVHFWFITVWISLRKCLSLSTNGALKDGWRTGVSLWTLLLLWRDTMREWRCPLMLRWCTISAVRVCVAERDCADVGDVGMTEINLALWTPSGRIIWSDFVTRWEFTWRRVGSKSAPPI